MNPDPNGVDRVALIKDSIKDVKEIMINNIDRQLHNMQSLDDLERQTDRLVANSKSFKIRSKKLRCQKLIDNWKFYLLVFCLLAGTIACTVLIIVKKYGH